MSVEQERLKDAQWKKWGSYVSDRQWGTVREDYSETGDAWQYTTHDMARSKAWRWGEEGIGGICDDQQLLCFSVALWNKKDPIVKEILYGLSNNEGNHGEDVKELYYYLDATPTHSYMKMLYKYPQQTFPYQQLKDENARLTRKDPEFEILDTGIFDDNKYFDVFIEYAKADVDDILIKITIHNRGDEEASLHVLPTVWFRNTWSWGHDDYRPSLNAVEGNVIEITHKALSCRRLYFDGNAVPLFCENETNVKRLYNIDEHHRYYKDGVSEHLITGEHSVNPDRAGSKMVLNYEVSIPAGQSQTIRLRLGAKDDTQPFVNFDSIFETRLQEANEFYADIQNGIKSEDEKMIQRQAFAGMLWSKQYYYYNVQQWLEGDPALPAPPQARKKGRNADWKHLNNANIISMPDKWEYPWYASWDLAFHCISIALVDPDFAKHQLRLLTKEWFMHPGGHLPAYEWSFNDANPPVHAFAAWKVYQIDATKNNGKHDYTFLESIFHKLLLNFTWWVNRKDKEGNNVFEGGFLGLDNVGVFDRNAELPDGVFIEQADGTSWMAMYALNMLHMSLELASNNKVYEDMSTKFFEHFLYIAGAMSLIGEDYTGLWDEDDEFFYDQLRLPYNGIVKLKVRSVVGLTPLFAVEIIDKATLTKQPAFAERMQWFLENRPALAGLVSRWYEAGSDEKHLLSLLRGHRIKRLLSRMLDETEFLSEHGIRSLSKYHKEHPYVLNAKGTELTVGYLPGESDTDMFGGNSNWRGPVWFPVNYLIVESLRRFHDYYSDDFTVEYPTNSGNYLSLREVADELIDRLIGLFTKNAGGKRTVSGDNEKLQTDPYFKDYIQFHEYFNGDTGKGLGAAHQTGWTGLIANLIEMKRAGKKL
ncbi:MGH1-like glycoside hydrolase domain-containing protein [Chitinophagaceae bacterium LWZ2-11]